MLAVLALAALVPAAGDSVKVTITEFTVPWENSRPRDPYVDHRGRIWFVGQVGNYIAYLIPSTGEFKRYELDPGVNPHNLIVEASGTVWYAGNRAAHIGKLDPETGTITKYPMPDPAARDPHTLIFDGKGHIWFSVQGGNMVGRLVMATGQVDLVKMPTPNARPYGIVIDRNGRPWFDEFGTDKIGTLDPKTMELKEYRLPDARARPRRIALTSDGLVWYGDYSRGYLGRIDPKTGEVKEWPAPSGGQSLPYAMASDDQDRVWFVETGPKPNRLVAFDPRSETWVNNTPVLPSGGGTVRHMVYHAPTKTIWFGTDTNQIGKAVIGPARELTP
jgi:virginiamycin B lyase